MVSRSLAGNLAMNPRESRTGCASVVIGIMACLVTHFHFVQFLLSLTTQISTGEA